MNKLEVDSTETDERAAMTLRFPPSLAKRVRQAAKESGMSINTWMTKALEYGLDPRNQTK